VTIRTACSVAICISAAIARFDAQAPAGRPQTPPTFRAEIQLVEIDVSVTDPEGRFVRGLTRDDFEILEDGVPQAVASFSFVDLPVASARLTADTAVEPDVTTNTGEGRMYVMLLDAPTAPAFDNPQGAQTWAHQFVTEALRPNDIVAVVHMHGNLSDGQPFTGTKRLIRASIDRYVGASTLAAGTSTPCEEIARLRVTYQAIEDVSERLGAVNGRRKAILWIGGNIPFDASASFGGSADSGEPCTGAAAASSVAFMHRDAIRAATRHNVAIYPIDPAGLTTTLGPVELSRVAALRTVAEDTGGEVIVGTNNARAGFERLVQHNSTYYLLGYYPAVQHRDGRFHNVTVRVGRRGLSVRAKRGYFALAADSKTASPASLIDGLSAGGRGALRSPAPVRGLAIELFAAPFKGTGTLASVVLGAHVSGRQMRLADGDEVEVSYIPINQQGEIGRGARKVFTLNLKPETRARVEETGVRFVDRLQLRPGRHELRFVVHQPGGATGSVVAQVDVPDFTRDALAMSGLAVASRRTADDLTLLSDDPLKTLLSADPTAIRTYARNDELSLYAEVYVNAPIPVDDIDLTYTIASASGAVLLTEPGWSEAHDTAGDARRIGFTAQLPLADLAPGSYVITARASSPDGKATTSRQVPFAVVPE
jgi:VWFA-related protein